MEFWTWDLIFTYFHLFVSVLIMFFLIIFPILKYS